MIKQQKDYTTDRKENMRGGEGAVTVTELLTSGELVEKGRLCARLKLEPGSSIGYHVHDKEMELFYILGGEAEYSDNGKTIALYPGDTTLTPNGEGHSIKSVGNMPLELLALILYI